MENCVAPGLDEFDVLLEVVLSLVRVPEPETLPFAKAWIVTEFPFPCSLMI